MNVKTSDGKYEYVFDEAGTAKALRYGDEWRDLTGDKFVYQLAADLQEARDLLEKYEAQFEQSNKTIAKLIEAIGQLQNEVYILRKPKA